jgi:hypothetical protein
MLSPLVGWIEKLKENSKRFWIREINFYSYCVKKKIDNTRQPDYTEALGNPFYSNYGTLAPPSGSSVHKQAGMQ